MYPLEKVTLYKYELDNLKRQAAKLKALEDGGVSNWEYYTYSLRYWQYKVDQEELIEDVIEYVNDLLTEADVDQPAGSGCGYSISFEEERLKEYLLEFATQYMLKEANKPID